MLRNVLLALFAVVELVASAKAGVIISQTAARTVGLSGYTTWTLTASTNDGSQIQGFDFASLPSYGFFGLMNQVNPAGISTIFQDANGFFPFVGADISQDSQFKFLSSNLTVPSGFASESGTTLRAVFAAGSPLGTSVPFVQLALPDAAAGTVSYLGQVQTVKGNVVTNNDVAGVGSCLDCYPPVASDEIIDNVNANAPGFLSHKILVGGNPTGLTIDSFKFDSYVPAPGAPGSGPAVAATLDSTAPSTYFFNWNTTGSPLGTYKWTYSAHAIFGSDGGSLTVRITAIPEPSTFALSILVLCCSLIGTRRRLV